MSDLSLLALGLALLALLCGVAGLHLYASGRAQRAALLSRLAATPGEGQGPADAPAAEAHGRPGSGRRRRFEGLDRRLRRTEFGRRLRLRLQATGLDLTAGEYTAYVLGAVLALWLIASAVLAPFFGPVFAAAALWGGNAFLTWQRTRRTERFIGQLPELARLIANGTAAGLALRTALSMAAEEMDDPAGAELATVANQLAVGRSLDEALGELGDRLPSRELNVLVTTLILANRAGGTIVASLRNLTTTLEERKETRREVRTMLAEVNATALTVPALGLGALLVINAMQPGALGRVTGSAGGQIAMLVALGLYAVGFFVVRRFGRIDV
ncbi:type II secretion system F family protein [Streptomyces sp. DSM 44917]|uniref:Type II secretion system F family protein n=1 Tax=Streptomyces boetiae TaxID=3075541 RepID=A0ABU2LFJ0_9ACTN|nr:type II secretion system F family protein [Streptomyces sp. DSM 44917]MDT0310355.1 type II secretion system F family protein [Streptomyces sp. DSM 44917]